MIINSAAELRELTASYYANNDFSKISTLLEGVESEVATTVGLQSLSSLTDPALLYARQAVAFMGTMRFYRLNDLSHETSGRKAKIDRENEARPFEWQLARDERAHLEEYYRALDRLIAALQDNADYQQTAVYQRIQALVVKDADSLNYLTGLDPSPWLFQRLVPFLWESQLKVMKAYGEGWDTLDEQSSELQHAAQMAVALGGVRLMGSRMQLQSLPYGLMRAVESDGGGNGRQQAGLGELQSYLQHMHEEYRDWLNEMQDLRDKASGESFTHLQMPDNSDGRKRFVRV